MKECFVVEESYQGLRLDVYLAQTIENIPSRSFVKKLIDNQSVTVNGKLTKTKYRVMTRDKIEVNLDPNLLGSVPLTAQNMEVDIFYEDPDIVIINKPMGLTVHPATGRQADTLVNALLGKFAKLSDVHGQLRPGIVHRLDKDTSGLMVIAKTNVAHARLARQFEKHTVVKRYIARVEGMVQFDQGMVDVPIGRHQKYYDQRRIVEEGQGQEAITFYQVLKRFKKSTLVALYPRTGRTHQLRLHMKHLGHPILGDDKYGRKESFSRLALHAQSIAFTHPIIRQYIEFSGVPPVEFCRGNE